MQFANTARAAAVGLILLLAGVAKWAIANEPPAPSDPRILEACVAHHPPGQTGADACIGALTRACEAVGRAETACIRRERIVWDAWHTRDVDRLVAALPPDARTYLREAERRFLSFKDQKCGPVGVAGPASPGNLAGEYCHMAEIARQWMWVESRFDKMPG